MKKTLFLMFALLATVGIWAETYHFVTAQTQVTSITSGNYYVIDGLNQVNSGTAGHFLFDNGTKVTSNNPQTLPTDPATVGKFIWRIVGNSTDGWTLQNLATGNYMSLGSSNSSPISSSSTPQTNGISFGDGDYATIYNSNGQAIDIGAYGDNPTTWSGGSTPGGSRRLVIYEVNVVEIADDACYYINFVSKDENTKWGLKSSSSSTINSASAGANSGDVYVAHSYTNLSGAKRWIFVNNANGEYLAYHGAANSAFNISKPINEFNIALLSGSYVESDAPVAGKLCITADNRTTSNANAGAYIIKVNGATYDNSSAPYYSSTLTSALEFNAAGVSASATATLAIAKFEALYEVKSYLPYAANISVLFADPSSIEANINAAATAEAAATIATNFMKSPEGKKFYAVASTATGQYMNIGPSAVSATSTTLTPEGVMELEYAGNGKYYLKGVKSEKYAGAPGNPPSTYSAKGDATAFYVGNYENATDNKVYFAKTKKNSNDEALHYNNTYTTYVTNWQYSAGASQWDITAVSDADYTELCNNYCDVTFNAIMAASGEVKATAITYDAERGAALAMPSAIARDYCTVTFYSDAACTTAITTVPDAATATVYALVTYTPPFTLSASYDNATWYYANLRGSKYVRADESAKDGSGRYTTNTTNEKTDVYKWAFVGTNPYDLTIMNRGAGSSKVLYAESTSLPTMKAGVTPASDNKARWIATPNTQGAFAFRNESGATLYINDAGGGGNLGFWNSSWATGDAGSNWVITEVPTVDVTYNLSVGGETVNTIVVNDVLEYSEVAVPAGLTNGYTTFAYDFATSGTIGGENSTITVTGTLKSGLVLTSGLSNNKKYKLKTSSRGSLSTKTVESTTYLASTCKEALNVSAKDFAILHFANHYYLYSVDDEKFVTYQEAQIAPLADNVTSTSDAIAFEQVSNGVYAIKFDNSASKYLNSSASYTYGMIINNWGGNGYWDDGNQYVIEEVDDFDPKEALGILTGFNNIIANLKTINWSEVGEAGQLGRYNLIGDFAGFRGNEMAVIETMEQNGYSDEAYSAAQAMNTKGVGYALNLPQTGKFLRVKGGNSGNYVKYNGVNGKYPLTDTPDNTAIFYFDGTHMLSYSSGIYWGATGLSWDWATVGGTGSTITFSESHRDCYYYVGLEPDASKHTYCMLYDNSSTCDRGGSTTLSTFANNNYTWTLEEVTTLPVTISAAKYATLYSPVALTIPTGVTAYAAKSNGNYINLTPIDGGIIPAETGVVLEGSAGTYDFAVTTGGDADSDLQGTIAAAAIPSSGTTFVLGVGASSQQVGFYKYNGTTLGGFKAYLNETTSSNEFLFNFVDDDPTAIVSAINGQTLNGQYYDLTGRKVVAPQKGNIYIVNGKKVLY